jgi:hypothetical protein
MARGRDCSGMSDPALSEAGTVSEVGCVSLADRSTAALAMTSHQRYYGCSFFERRPLRTDRSRHQQLLRRDVERMVHERGDILLHAPDLLAHSVDRELEIASILVNSRAALRTSNAISTSGPGRELLANKSMIAAIVKSATATTAGAQTIPIELCSAL